MRWYYSPSVTSSLISNTIILNCNLLIHRGLAYSRDQQHGNRYTRANPNRLPLVLKAQQRVVQALEPFLSVCFNV